MFENYNIISEVGRGGTAVVYLAEHKSLYKKVAIKTLHDELFNNDDVRKRFLAEARKMAQLSHPNIIKVSDLIEDPDKVAFVMDYIEGDNLREYIHRRGRLTDEDIYSLLVQMLDGMEYIHTRNLVHRDIKPSNFIVDKSGKVYLMDFGISKDLSDSFSDYNVTHTTQLMGTPMYMSPEQIQETKSVTALTDIYSLGVVIWQMVTGRSPYNTEAFTDFQIKSKIISEKLPITNSKWDTFISIATEKKQENRVQSIADFKAKLSATQIKGKDNSSTPLESEFTVIEKKASNKFLSFFTKIFKKLFTFLFNRYLRRNYDWWIWQRKVKSAIPCSGIDNLGIRLKTNKSILSTVNKLSSVDAFIDKEKYVKTYFVFGDENVKRDDYELNSNGEPVKFPIGASVIKASFIHPANGAYLPDGIYSMSKQDSSSVVSTDQFALMYCSLNLNYKLSPNFNEKEGSFNDSTASFQKTIPETVLDVEEGKIEVKRCENGYFFRIHLLALNRVSIKGVYFGQLRRFT